MRQSKRGPRVSILQRDHCAVHGLSRYRRRAIQEADIRSAIYQRLPVRASQPVATRYKRKHQLSAATVLRFGETGFVKDSTGA